MPKLVLAQGLKQQPRNFGGDGDIYDGDDDIQNDGDAAARRSRRRRHRGQDAPKTPRSMMPPRRQWKNDAVDP